MTDTISELEHLLHGSGEFLRGHTGEIEDAISEATDHSPAKPFCLVRSSRIIKVLVTDEYAGSLETDGLSPYVLYAEDVVLHSMGKRPAGQWVRSTFQRSFTKGFLFETRILLRGTKVQGSVRAGLATTGQLERDQKPSHNPVNHCTCLYWDWFLMPENLDINLSDDLLADLLFGPARMLGGTELEQEELIRIALARFDRRPLIVVATWMILDVILPSIELTEVEEEGLKSTVIYANRVLFTTHPQEVSSYGVVSGYQAGLDGCIFESKDALYILSGRGARKHVSLPALIALQQSVGGYAL